MPPAAVLRLLGTADEIRGSQYRGPCPLHGTARGSARCFSANLSNNLFQCFKCGRGGDALDLWAQTTKQAPYDAALDLCERLTIPLPLLPPTRSPTEPVINPPKIGTMPSPHHEASP